MEVHAYALQVTNTPYLATHYASRVYSLKQEFKGIKKTALYDGWMDKMTYIIFEMSGTFRAIWC